MVEIILAVGAGIGTASAAMVPLIKVLKEWSIEKRKTAAEVEGIKAQTLLTTAEAGKTLQEAERGRLSNLVYVLLLNNLPDGMSISAEQLSALIEKHPGALEALDRLSNYEITVDEIEAGQSDTPTLDPGETIREQAAASIRQMEKARKQARNNFWKQQEERQERFRVIDIRPISDEAQDDDADSA